MKEYSLDEMFDLWAKQDSFVTISDDLVIINVAYAYEIPRAACDTHGKILAWMVHLCEKTWISPAVLREFAYKASQAAGIEIPFP